MVANALDDGDRSRVAHAEALARLATEEGAAARGAVERAVAQHDMLLGHQPALHHVSARRDADLAAGETLAAAAGVKSSEQKVH